MLPQTPLRRLKDFCYLCKIMRKVFYIFAVALIMLAGCTADRLEPEPQEQFVTGADGVSVNVATLQNGRMRIYVSEETAERLETDTGFFISENANLGITSIKRSFPFDEQFEGRTRKSGLHRWYDVEFDSETPLTKAGKEIGAMEGVSSVEYRPKIVRHKGQTVDWKHASATQYAALKQSRDELPFDDPDLAKQWHYCNLSSQNHSVPGCDINVFPVWRNFKSGDPSVIVAIVDGGIDFKHEDLKDNMWHNPDQSGEYVYGYDFVNDTYRIRADEHGTHIAGTIAAVNNNGIGCCGIAGGDAKAGIEGVKLMSCQIFLPDDEEDSGDDAAAIKWAADHGAIICSNSWAYDGASYLPAYSKAAIDYFNEFAGTDEFGNQTGPMKGGVVIFAAGNEFTKERVYPSSYSEVLAVSALGADFRLASYSNYGDWVDIAAPGGDDEYDIYSTKPGNRYGWEGGTSMATPHVSGVAALIVANCGGEGFTRENLIDILLHHTTDINDYNPHKYPGIGLVNAAAAINSNNGKVDFYISDLDITADGNSVKASILASPDSEESEAWISAAYIYYSETPFSDTENVPYFRCEIGTKITGEALVAESGRLEYDKRYYIAIALQDEYGHFTPATRIFTIDTAPNLPPAIEGPSGPFTVKAHESLEIPFTISDPYGDSISIELISNNGYAVQINTKTSPVKVYLRGFNSSPGSFSFTLRATDEFGLSTENTYHYSVEENHAPELTQPIADIIIEDNQTITLNLDDYFYDADGEEISYSLVAANPSVVKLSTSSATLYLIPQQYGSSVVSVTATDAFGKTASCSFRLLVRDGNRVVELYPNPVTGGKLFARTGRSMDVDIVIYNAAGGLVLKETAQINPFEPFAMDLSHCAAGVYNVTTTAAGNSSTTKIVKL